MHVGERTCVRDGKRRLAYEGGEDALHFNTDGAVDSSLVYCVTA